MITGLYGSSNDILHALIRLKVEALRDHFKSLVYRGDASANSEEFDGLRRFTANMGTFDPVQPGLERLAELAGGPGSAVQRGDIEGLLGMIDPRPEPDATYLVMHSKVFEHVARQGVLDSEVIHDPDLGILSAVAGVPILIDDFAPVDESFEATTTSSIYAVVLGENTGLCGIYPSANEGAEIQVRGPFVKDDKDRSCYHLTWDIALAGFNSGAVARLKEIAFET